MLRRLADVAHTFVKADEPERVLRALKVVSDAADIGGVSVGCSAGKTPLRNFRAVGVKEEVLRDWADGYLKRGLSLPARYAALGPPAFTMAEMARRLQPSGEDHWLSDLLHDYGMRDTLWCAYGPWMVRYHSSRPLDQRALPEDVRAGLDAAGAMAVGRLKELTQLAEGHPRLSSRERTILLHLSQGLTAPQIAARLYIAEPTVRTFVNRAIMKLGAKSQLHAVAIALRRGLT
jgi:DNA-binding CsgD family transcriptional regulator